jgi:hypothetical protein
MKYKNKWFGRDDKAFWEEVLVDRKIVSINYAEQLYSLTLDSGEKVFVSRPDAIYVRCEKDEVKR